MKYQHTRHGFTLIELLVIVLIIGVLAAVAVPQYQKAVAKAKYIQLLTVSESVLKAADAYYLANGEYTTDIEKLDIEFPPNMQQNFRLFQEARRPGNYAVQSTLPNLYRLQYIVWSVYGLYAKRKECRVLTTAPNYLHQLCKEISNTPNGYKVNSNLTGYIFQE